MNHIRKLSFILVFMCILLGCSRGVNGGNDQVEAIETIVQEQEQLSKYDQLQEYLDYEKAEVLLLETWLPFKTQMESDTRIALDDLIRENPKIDSQYLERTYKIILNGQGSDSVKLNKNNFVPIITDEEVEITNIVIEEFPDEVIEYFLKITEYGEFRDRDPIHGGRRESVYYIDQNGEIKLFNANGGLSLLYLPPN